MKLLCVTLLFLVSSAFAAPRAELELDSQEIKQGALVRGTLRGDPELVSVPIPKLKGNTFGDTIYFHKISPLLKKEGSLNYESEVQVIFTKVPETSSLVGKVGDTTLTIGWNSLKIIPVEIPGQMLWAEFTAPDILTGTWVWIWATPLLLILCFVGHRAWRHFDRKARLRRRRKALATEIVGCSSYSEVVAFWQKKHSYLLEFPQLEESFRKFEVVLFKYQFKPSQTDEEKSAVMSAYRELVQETEGDLRGI